MVHILRGADRAPSASRTIRFEGDQYGAGISFFAVDTEPGKGPALHVHPYPETWIVKSGKARVEAGDKSFDVGPNDIAIVPGGVPHKFTNIGPGQLEMVCIHSAGTMVQQDLE